MAAKEKTTPQMVNRRAFHDYEIVEKFEAGIALQGTEVKALRGGEGSIAESYAEVSGGEVWLINANIPEFSHGNRFNHETLRPRRLLAHKREILKLQAQQEQKGLTLIPLKLYLVPKTGRIKLEIGVCRGKLQADKRETIKRREADRDARRAVAAHTRR